MSAPTASATAGRRFSQGTVPELHAHVPGYQPVSETEYQQEQELQAGLSDLTAQLEDMNYHVADMDAISQQTEDAVKHVEYNALDPRSLADPSLSVEREVEMPAGGPRAHGGAPKTRAVNVVPGLDGHDAIPRVDTALLKKTSGYLWKKGGSKGGRHNWKRRFFYLKHELTNPSESFELYYFAKESDDVPKGALSLENADIEVDEAQKKERKNKGHGNFEFQILVGGGRVFEVSADEEQDRNDWVDTLRYVVSVAKRARVSHAAVSRSAQALQASRSAADQALNCEAFGPGLFGAPAGARAQFTVQANDERGNPHSFGGARFLATLTNDDLHYDLKVFDNQDGTYVVEYCTCRAGTYQLFITLGSYDIYGSPFTVTVGPGSAHTASCIVKGEGVASATLGSTNYFTVVARDEFENELAGGGSGLQCAVASGSGPERAGDATLQGFRDNGNGTYSAAYQIAARAEAPPAISVTLGVAKDGVTPLHVAGSPFRPALTAAAAVEPALAGPEEEDGAGARIPTPGSSRIPGPGGAASPAPAPAPPALAGASMADPAVAELFGKHEPQLRAVFGHYGGGAPALPLAAVVKLGADFDIVPTFLSRKELKGAAAAGAGGAAGLDFGAFVEVLRQCALSALSKPPFDGIYKTEEAKVTVLLEMWGLGDGTKLAKVQKQ